MSDQHRTWTSFVLDLILVMAPVVAGSYMISKYMGNINGPKDGADDSRTMDALRAAYQQWHAHGKTAEFPKLDAYEELILGDMTFPHQINVTLNDIGGLESIKESIWETVLLPLQNPDLFASDRLSSLPGASSNAHALLSAPLGVLFYGPPGTGKTMMAKAIAKECRACFIPVNFSTLESKWYGDSQKLVRAVFSLARKFSPAIVFIDEVDTFLGARDGNQHEVSSRVKGEFMAQWDGLATNHTHPVLVLGATNRPFDLDTAILRRFPRQIMFDLPSLSERTAILKVLLSTVAKPDDLVAYTAQHSDKYSGSDLKELCKFAAMQPIREFVRHNRQHMAAQKRKTLRSAGNVNGTFLEDDDSDGDVDGDVEEVELMTRPRALNRQDIDMALDAVKPTGAEAMKHLHSFYSKHQQAQARQVKVEEPVEEENVQRLLELFSSMMKPKAHELD